MRIACRDLRRREIAGRDIVVIPKAQIDHLTAREQLPHLRSEDAEVGTRIGRGFRTGVRGKNMQHADAEFAVLILLAPNTRRSVHQRRKRSVGAAQSPHSSEFFGVEGSALTHQPDGGGNIARLLNGRFQPRAQRIVRGTVMSPQTAVLHVDRLRKVGGHREESSVRDVIHPLDDFRNRAPGSGHFARFLEQRYADLLLRTGNRIANRDLLRIFRQRRDPQAIVEERIARG